MYLLLQQPIDPIGAPRRTNADEGEGGGGGLGDDGGRLLLAEDAGHDVALWACRPFEAIASA